jgi:hypothetical protein
VAALGHDAGYLYVYAIVPSHAGLCVDVRGVGGEKLALLPCGAVAAVVGQVSQERWERTAVHLRSHQTVVEAVRQAGEALPVRFGTVMRGEAAVAETLCRQGELLCQDLARLGSMVELDLAVLAASPALREGATVWAEPLVAGSNLRGSGAGARYLRGRMRAHTKAQLCEERLRAVKSVIDESLSVHAREVRWTDLASERIACIAAYLVDPGSIPEFRRAFGRLCGEREEFRLMLTEPSAPYSFVTLTNHRASGLSPGTLSP